MSTREINEKISKWIGRECSCVAELDSENLKQGIPQYTTYWGDCSMHRHGGLPTPYATSDRCAVELISELASRGAKTILESYPDGNVGYGCQISHGPIKYSALQPTIAEAITSAVVGIIDRCTDQLASHFIASQRYCGCGCDACNSARDIIEPVAE